MSYGWMLVLGLGLAMDAFAVSITQALRVSAVMVRHALGMALLFGVFQAGMPLAGSLVGSGVSRWIHRVDHWIAFGLLACIGGRMVWTAWRERPNEAADDATRCCQPWPSLRLLLVLAVATSIDAFAVGIGFPALDMNVPLAVGIIGIVTLVLSYGGALTGKALGVRFGRRAEILGGLLLCAIGLRVLVTHMW